jgi:hypothetical protein
MCGHNGGGEKVYTSVHSVLLGQNITDWRIYKEKTFLFTVLEAGESSSI